MKLHNFFLLNIKKLIWVVVAWIAAVLLHNLISGLLGIEGAVFFLIAVIIIPLYFIISLIYSLTILIHMKVKKRRKRKKK